MYKIKYKLTGAMLLATVVAIATWILLAGGIFLAQSGQLQILATNHSMNQAKQYAELDANLLKGISYDQLLDSTALGKLDLHLSRGAIQTTDAPEWEDEIVIGGEKTAKNGTKFRTATINIYQQGDTKPRYQLDISLSQDVQPYTRAEIDSLIAQKEAEEMKKINEANKYVDDALKKAGVTN